MSKVLDLLLEPMNLVAGDMAITASRGSHNRAYRISVTSISIPNKLTLKLLETTGRSLARIPLLAHPPLPMRERYRQRPPVLINSSIGFTVNVQDGRGRRATPGARGRNVVVAGRSGGGRLGRSRSRLFKGDVLSVGGVGWESSVLDSWALRIPISRIAGGGREVILVGIREHVDSLGANVASESLSF